MKEGFSLQSRQELKDVACQWKNWGGGSLAPGISSEDLCVCSSTYTAFFSFLLSSFSLYLANINGALFTGARNTLVSTVNPWGLHPGLVWADLRAWNGDWCRENAQWIFFFLWNEGMNTFQPSLPLKPIFFHFPYKGKENFCVWRREQQNFTQLTSSTCLYFNTYYSHIF